MNYEKAQARIKKLNRRIGQYYRYSYAIWYPDKLDAALDERYELQKQLPQLKQKHEDNIAFWNGEWF